MTARIYGEQNATIVRRWCAQRNELVGPTANYYSLVRGANVDPLYSEPVADPLYGGPPQGTLARHADAFEYLGPRGVIMAVIFERVTGANSTADEKGIDTEYDGEGYVARNEWEAKWPGVPPKKGDVLWVSDEWWDVVGAKSGGHVTDSGHYVEWKFELKKREHFLPDRKI